MRISHLAFVLAVAIPACAARPQLPTATTNAALARYARGETFADISRELSLGDRDTARTAVHEALRRMWERYYREH
jgi:hypothetical protein